jgi:hypothetical protein
MVCLQKPGALVRYAAPTAKALRKIIRPLMTKILRDCPDELRPQYLSAEGMYKFPNGSEIHLAGVNGGHADDLRGTACDLFIVDEARDVDDLDYLVHDVAMPQFLDPDGNVVKGRRLLIASSAASSPDHPFATMCADAEVEGNYSEYDIFDGQYPLEVIRMFLEEDGVDKEDIEKLFQGDYTAIKSATVKREYLNMAVVDEERAIVPEWKEEYEIEWDAAQDPNIDPLYQFWHKYEFLDIGVQVDKTVCLFGYYNFLEARLYIMHEVDVSGSKTTTDLIYKAITDKEKEIGYSDVYRRVADNSHPLLLNDLSAKGVPFAATDKEKLHEMVGELRVWTKAGRVRIHKRCKQAIGCMRSGIWDAKRKEFERSKVLGHYDALAALIYGVRNLDVWTNPVPSYIDNPGRWPVKKKSTLSPMGQDLKAAFTVRR